ncbi:glycoside hydrolase superfamily [Leptodontidium sp. 2 PMI_412]|nr:glycoside hydrolase superfamily [Leptodontidium sp. 2 PMI_412]
MEIRPGGSHGGSFCFKDSALVPKNARINPTAQNRPWAEDWIALGGWTFSDNETDTQPVWGDLSSTPAKRKIFIGQLMKFMDFWGLDGVDLDWEYPGASDRWVTKNDGQIFVYLLEDIKIAFASRPGRGLSFMALTSYWYLRWFPIGRMYQHGESGVLSFAEIESMKKIYGYKPIFDEKTAVKYFAFNEDQWVPYDDAETLQLKVEYAQKQGLLGLFIWSVDLDTKSHDALKALLGGQLNKFSKKDGVQKITDDCQSVSGTQCVWSVSIVPAECGTTLPSSGAKSRKPSNPRNRFVAPSERLMIPTHEVGKKLPGGRRYLLGSCGNGRIPVITSTYPMMKELGKDVATVNACQISGKAVYCCSERLSGASPCTYYPDTCIGINKDA